MKVRHALAAVTAAAFMLTAHTPAQADDENFDPIETSGQVVLDQNQVDSRLGSAETPDTVVEASAVEAYLDGLPEQGAEVDASDLEVGTVEVGDGVTATVVMPEIVVDVKALAFQVDAGANEVSAAAQLELPADAVDGVTAGPGMGSWPSWTDSPSWVVELRLYRNDNYIGEAEFQTQRRKYQETEKARDIWQVARRARATPDEIEVNNAPDASAYVKKLWVSSKLTDAQAPYAQQWRQDLTNPDSGFSNCSNNVSISAGPFGFSPSNCEDYDVWQGAVGHMRFDYDQGAWAGGEARAIAYVSGFQMDNGRFPNMTWYEFVTLRLGHVAGQPEYKCTSTDLGLQNDTEHLKCDF